MLITEEQAQSSVNQILMLADDYRAGIIEDPDEFIEAVVESLPNRQQGCNHVYQITSDAMGQISRYCIKCGQS